MTHQGGCKSPESNLGVWLDEHGRPDPTRPPHVLECDREWPQYRHRLRHLVMVGWKPMKPMLLFNWSGHGLQTMPWSERDDYWVLVPIVDAVARR